MLHANGLVREMRLQGRAFHAPVALKPGLNHLTVLVTGVDGQESEDSITIEYLPRPAPASIVLTSPRDGLVLGPDDPPAVTVEGTVEDPTLATVWVTANGHAMEVPLRDKHFRQVVPVLEPLVRLWVESRMNGAVQRSDTTSVTREATAGPIGLLLLQWEAGAMPGPVEIVAAWRGTPGRIDAPAVTLPLRSLGIEGNGGREAFYLRNLRPGVYMFTLRLAGGRKSGELRSTLYYADNGSVLTWSLKPVSVDGTSRVVLARVLLPHGVLWEQNAWFTGKSESSDTIVKFRAPEGITWAERKADLR